MNCLNCYGYKENDRGLVSLKTQFQDEQGAVDKAQDKKIDELAELINEESGETVEKMVEIAYDKLVDLRDTSKLSPGQLYRITDYETTTAQENTRSAGHQFDIIVLATSANTLSEEAMAIQHEGGYDGVYVNDDCIYTGRKIIVHFEDVTKKLYFWHYVNGNDYEGYYSELSLEELKQLTQEELKETLWVWIDDYNVISENEIDSGYVYDDDVETFVGAGFSDINCSFDSYFTNSNLSAWKLKYCLDNDTSRFAWALEEKIINNIITVNIGEEEDTTLYIQTNGPVDGAYIYEPLANSEGLTPEEYIEEIGTFIVDNNGTILYSVKSSSDLNPGVDVLVNGSPIKPMSYIVSGIFDLNQPIKTGGKGVIYRMIDEWDNECPYDFKNIQFKRYKITECEAVPDLEGMYAMEDAEGIIVDTDTTFWCYTFCMIDAESGEGHDVSVEQDVYYSDEGFAYKTHNNVFKPYYYIINDDNDEMIYLMTLPDNVITTDTELCSIEGNFGEFYGYYNNIFGSDCFKNTITNNFNNNTIGDYCNNNTIGDYFSNNTIGNNFGYNTIGNNFYNNTIGAYFSNNNIENNFSDNTIGNKFRDNIIGNYFSYNTIGNNCYENTIGINCYENTIGNGFASNIIGNDFGSNTIGNDCNNITIEKDCVHYIIIEDGNQCLTITSTQTTSLSNQLRNFTIAQGANNTNTNKIIYHNSVSDTQKTVYSSGSINYVSIDEE